MKFFITVRENVLDFLSVVRICLFPFVFLTAVNFILYGTGQGLELMQSINDDSSLALPILAVLIFGFTCGFTVRLLLTQATAYSKTDRSSNSEAWLKLIRVLTPCAAVGLSILPSLTWLLILSNTVEYAQLNASNMGVGGSILIVTGAIIWRKKQELGYWALTFGVACLIPWTVLMLKVRKQDSDMETIVGTIWPQLEMVSYFFAYWGLVTVLSAAALRLERARKVLDMPVNQSWKLKPRQRVVLSMLIILYVAIFYFISHDNLSVSRQLGPLGVLLSGFGLWILALSLIFVYLPRLLGLPSLSLLILVFYIWFSTYNDNHKIRTVSETTPSDLRPESLPDYMTGWLLSREIRPGERFPVFIVTAEGGGARATYWTASVLAMLDEATDGKINNHLFAISGVSGGSFGAALYASALADRRDGLLPHSTNLKDIVQKVAADDFLSPLLAGTLFGDFAQRLLPWVVFPVDRAALFEQAWESGWRTHVGTRRFEQTIGALYSKSGKRDSDYRVPALFLNATEVNTGRKFLMTNVDVSHGDFPETFFMTADDPPIYDLSRVPLSALAHMSARFPYVSPAATILGKASPMLEERSRQRSKLENAVYSGENRLWQWGAVVDGGYLDNSGAGTAAELLEAMRFYEPQLMRALSKIPRLKNVTLDYYVLIISNDPAASSSRPFVYNFSNEGGSVQDSYLPFGDASVAAKGRSGLPLRPVEPPPDRLAKIFYQAEKTDRLPDIDHLFRTGTTLSEATSPILAVLNARTARADASKTALAALASAPPKGFFSSHCCDPTVIGVSEKLGEQNPCRLSARSFEASLGVVLSQMDEIVITATGHAGVESPRRPALGWYLRGGSRVTMEKAVERLGRQDIGAIANTVVLAYANGVGSPRTTCEMSLFGSSEDQGVKNWLKKNGLDYTP